MTASHVRELFGENTSQLLAVEAARHTSMPLEGVRAAFEDIATAGDCDVLYTVTSTGGGGVCARAVLCLGASEAAAVAKTLDECNTSVYALRRRGAAFSARQLRPALLPSTLTVLRAYPLLTRAEAEAKVGTRGNKETTKPKTEQVATPKTEQVATPKTEQVAEAKGSNGELEVAKADPTPTEAAPRGKRQKTLFGAPAVGAKQPRAKQSAASKAEPKPKRPRASKVAPTSLAVLSKASAAVPVESRAAHLLDEDGAEDSAEDSAASAGQQMDEALLAEEPPALHLYAAAANDEVVLCDDAPPLVFCSPAAPTARRESARGEDGETAQPRLGGLFQPEVAAFQKGYARDVVTETVFEGGEYVCRDRVCYRHRASGEVLSTEAFHKRSADIARSAEAAASRMRPAPSAAGGGEAGGSRNDATKGVRQAATRVERPQRTPPRTLMSYFGKSS